MVLKFTALKSWCLLSQLGPCQLSPSLVLTLSVSHDSWSGTFPLESMTVRITQSLL